MSWFSRLRNAIRPQRLDEDLAEEIRDHIERRTAQMVEGGEKPAEARRAATTAFGNVTLLRERSREHRLWASLECTLQDAKYACRGLRRSPSVALTAIVSLGLAIGANTAIYSIFDAAFLRPLPVPNPERLFTLASVSPIGNTLGNGSRGRDIFSFPLFLQLREAAGESARLAYFSGVSRTETQFPDRNAPIQKAAQQFVSGEAFEILQVPPASGELFSSQEDQGMAGHPVAVLSHDYWRQRFHSDPAILGRNIVVDGRDFRVVGVARAGFTGIEPGKPVDIWLPVTMFDPGALTNPAFNWARIAGRLTAGLSHQAARKQLSARLQPAFHRDRETLIGRDSSMPAALRPVVAEEKLEVRDGAAGVTGFRQTFGRPLWIVLAIAAGMLLIACSNVASLLLARATARASEMALRVSLGAGRIRLLRQLFIESMLISLAAGLVGWGIAHVAAPVLMSLLAARTDPLQFELAMNTRVLLFCAVLCGGCAILFGMIPTQQALNTQPMWVLRHASGAPRRLLAGRLLVGMQIAFAFCMVVAGAGFLFSLRHLLAVDSGFDPRGVTVFTIGIDRGGPQLPDLMRLQARISRLAGVRGAAFAWAPIFEGAPRAQRVALPGQALSATQEAFYRVSPGYFETLRTPLLAGRDLTPTDNEGSEPVPTVVNRAFARKYFGIESALGREFRRDDGVRHQIVGIAANAAYLDLRSGPEPVVYFPMKSPRRFTLYVRSGFDMRSVVDLVGREVSATGPGIHLAEAVELNTMVGNSILREKLLAGIGGLFALLGLVLASIGLFGLLNYSVVRRTKEIGIRAALGARRSTLILLVLRDLFALLAGGLTLGLAGALGLLRFSRTLLFGVQMVDPLTIGTATAIFLAAALFAAGIPARRAARMDPVAALRDD